jgi:hypothetical protein
MFCFVFDRSPVTNISSKLFLSALILDHRQEDEHENKHDLYITLFLSSSSKVRKMFVIADQNLAYF